MSIGNVMVGRQPSTLTVTHISRSARWRLISKTSTNVVLLSALLNNLLLTSLMRILAHVKLVMSIWAQNLCASSHH